MAQDNNTGKPNNSQMLRDKLNQSLKQRLGRRTEAAQDAGAFAPEPEQNTYVDEIAYSAPEPSPSQSKAKSSKDRDFLDELAKEVDVEVSLMGNFAPFMETIDNDDKERKTPSSSGPTEVKTPKNTESASVPAQPQAAAFAPPPANLPSAPSREQDEQQDEASHLTHESQNLPSSTGSPATLVSSDSQGLKVMQEEPKNNDSSSSLRDLLKSGKSDSKSSGSSLKAPRQSAQNSNNTSNSNEDPISEASAQSNDGEDYPKRDAFLKAPRPSKQHSSTSASQDNEIPDTHEQEILHAIRRGDSEWITKNAQIALIDKARHEIITTLSLSQPQCLEALFAAGLPVDKNGGLALRTATQKKDYAALEVLKGMGVRVDLETLKALAAWRRATSRKDKTSEEAESAKANAERIQSDFDDFLQAHADELGIDDPSKFAIKDTPSNDSVVIDAKPETPEYEAEVPADLLSELEVALSTNTINPDLATPSLDSKSDDTSHSDTQQSANSKSKIREAREIPRETPAFNTPNLVPSTPKLATPNNATNKTTGRTQPTESLEPTMTAQTPPSAPNDRKAANVSSQGMSPMDKVKLATFDKVMQEKQLLEMKVMELQMYQDAAASMEEERNKLLDELAEAQEQKENAEFELDETKKEFTQFDTIKSQLESQLAQEKASSKSRDESHARERDRLMAAESNTASLLRDAERREGELRQGQQQLLAKIAELEKRGTPAPEANDWLEGTDKEANLRKGLFVEAILGGEYKTLGKISMNTAVEPEMAHLALVFAAEAGQLKCAQWLVDNMDVHPGFGGELALMRAIKHNHFDMIRWLAGNGADIHHADEFALRIAVDKDDVPMLDFLVSLGANVRAANERALREAAKGQSWSCFKALLGYGCTGLDQKGEPHPELADEDEATERLQWIAAQRKLAKTLDPDFAKRQKRKDI